MDWKNSNWARGAWTVLRVYLGYSWLTSGFEKVFGEGSGVWVGDRAGTAVGGFLNNALTKTSGQHPDVQWWYAWFIQHIALPNVKLFSYSVAWGELLIGIALILGGFTTAALLAGMFLNFNYLLAGSVSVNPIFILEAGVLLWAGAAAYYWGLDRYLAPRFKEIPFLRLRPKPST
ncbi:MAG: DoxX family membrane protein [Firmicutes bacterium]|nr:DoxX family membrane protein [Bacillota bacterium]